MVIARKHLLFGFLLIGGIAVAILVSQRPETRTAWTKESLAARLAEIGYKTAWVGPQEDEPFAQGLYVARQTDSRSWQEIARRPRTRPEELWYGLVLIQRVLDPKAPSHLLPSSQNERRMDDLMFFGDSEELDHIFAHLQP
jgi:hypothetical protein